MKRLISLEIGPNYQKDDVITTLKTLFLPNKKAFQGAKAKVENWFKDKFGVENVWFFDTCRGGIYLLLKSLNLNSDTEVLVQGFSCIVVPNAVLQANLKPIICDVSTENFNFDLDKLEAKITPNTKVWILQYNFGIVPNMQRVLEICNKYNLILIEDCAHSLGARFSLGKQEFEVGKFGHAAAFSFGRDKIISTTSGGAVIFNKENALQAQVDFESWEKAFEATHHTLEVMNLKASVQNLLYVILTTVFIKPLYYFGIGKAIAIFSTKTKLSKPVYTTSEKTLNVDQFPTPLIMSLNLFPLLLNQLNKLERYNKHRQELALIYANELDIDFNPQNVYLRLPIFIDKLTHEEIYNKIYTAMKNQGIFLGKWYNKVFLGTAINDEQAYNYKITDLTNISELIRNKVLNLPTNINTTTSDATKIANITKTALNK